MDTQWSPRFEDLKKRVEAAFRADSRDFLHTVYRDLEQSRDTICALLDTPPPNAAHRAQLKLGSPEIDGKAKTVNEQFIAGAIVLSDQLDMDEYYASSLLYHGIQNQARFDRTPVETAIILFHHERLHLLNCIYTLLDTSIGSEAPSEFGRAIEPFRKDLLDTTKGNLPSKVLAQIEALDKISVSLKNAMTETSPLVIELGMAINEDRLEYLKQERTLLATILFGVAFYHELSGPVLKATITALKKMTLSDPIAIYLTVAAMAALEVSEEHMLNRGKARDAFPAFMTEGSFIQEYARFITDSTWAVPAIRATITFQLSLCIGNVFDGRQDGMTEDELQIVTENAINADTFQFIANYILGFKSRVSVAGKQAELPFNMTNTSVGIVEQNTDGFETTIGKPADTQLDSMDVQSGVLELLEFTLRDFIIKMMPLLRRIKHKEEDNLNTQTYHRQPHSQHAGPSSRNDLAALFTVISLVYKDRPESSLRYWPIGDDRLHGFLKWGADCKIAARAFFDMIGSLAAGPQCAHFAYDFLKSNGGRYGTQSYSAPRTLCSWDKLFEAIEFYTNSLNQALATGGRIEKILPDEEEVLKSMLRLLCTVAHYSVPARCAMNDTKQYRVTHALFRFFICPISVDLKASILDTIAAFAAPTGLGGDNAGLVWDYLEQAKILPKSYGTAPEQTLAMDKSAVPHRQEHEQVDSGIGYDIQEIETANETYPETIAFTRLLSNLIQVPLNPEELLSGGSPTIPALLGSGYRQPGVIPYTRFVLDVIFIKALDRPYRSVNEKWTVLEACLNFMERCLLSFDIGSYILGSSLKSVQDRTITEAQTTQILRASQHPGFEIMTQLLSGGDVLRQVFKVLGTGVDTLNRDDQSTPYFKASILLCFRILSRTMQIQGVFLDYIVQVLLTTLGYKNTLLSSLVPIEEHLSFNHAAVVDIAMYVNCEVSNEICSLSIEILDRLSASSFFNNSTTSYRGMSVNPLVKLLESSPKSKQILYGFVNKLRSEDEESTFEYGAGLQENGGSHSMHLDGTEAATQKKVIVTSAPITISTIRLQIMRLLLDNLTESRTAPSIAHFLLGYPTETHVTKKAPTDVLASLTNETLLTVILELLRRGLNGQEYDENSVLSLPLYITHPQLAEKSQELVYRLCSDAHTNSSTMRFLRTQEAFFHRNLKALPISFGPGLEGHHGTFTSLNGTRFRGNLFNLLSQLYQRSWVMKSTALELLVACESKQRREAVGLLGLLYSGTDNSRTNNEDDYLYSLSRTTTGTLAQPRMKILELLDSIDFLWEDDLKVQDLERYYFADIPEDSCLEKDDYGVELFNARKLFSLLLTRKIQLENDNMISGTGHRNAARAELQSTMEQCLARNHVRRLEAGRKNAFEAWRELVEITLGAGFELLKLEQRETILYEVLEAVLTKIQRGCSADVTNILAKVALCVIQSLRFDKFRQFIFQASSANPQEIDARLPAERLHRIMREIIACVLRPGTPQSRCNMYSTLVNYFHFTQSGSEAHQDSITTSGAGSLREALELNNKAYIAEVGDRLLGTVCQDASDVDQVCKVAAFTLLNSLYGLFERETSNRILQHLVQRNYLKHFIEILAREDQELQAAVRGHVSRIPIVSETRMTLFLRIAQHRDGAEHLLDYGYFDVLSTSSTVIDMRSNLNTTDYGPFEQTESNRYHNIVYPMLQVAVAILANLGRNHRRASSKAEAFVTSHQDTFASILRDNDFPTTINSLRELRVVTAFMNLLAGRTSSPVFNQLHSLVLALIPKYFSADQWALSLQPVSDSEKILYATMAPSLTAKAGTTLFERDARSLSRDICKNLLSYSQISTESVARAAAQSFTPVYTWTIISVTNGHHDSSAMPSLSTLMGYLARITNEAQEILGRYKSQRDKFLHISYLTPEEKHNILEASDEPYIDDLVAVQRDQLAVQVLQKMLLTSSQEVDSSLYLLELTLVLLWRHLEYYLGQYAGMLESDGPKSGLAVSRFGQSGMFGASTQGPAGLGVSTFMASTSGLGASLDSRSTSRGVGGQSQVSKNYRPTLAEAQTLKREAGNIILSKLDDVSSLDLAQEGLSGSHSSFIELLTRRLRVLVERT